MTEETATATQLQGEDAASTQEPVETTQTTQEAPAEETSAQQSSSSPQGEETTQEPTTDEQSAKRVVPKPEEYKLPEGMPEELRQFAHDNQLTQEQLDKSLHKFGDYYQKMQFAQRESLINDGAKHIESWGDNAKSNLTLIRQALAQNDPKGELTQALNQTGYGSHPAVLDFLLGIGKSMQEGGFLKNAVRTPPTKLSMAQKMYGQSHSKED